MQTKIIAGKYKVVRELGRGGMGVIYEALHIQLNRTVALKVLHPQFTGDSAFLKRFQREARAMARLDHENIIRVFDVSEDRGSHYIEMEYFPGKDLKQVIIEEGSLSQRRALLITLHVANALSFAHSHGIVHRDIKPANIMINRAGVIKIADFGIAGATNEISVTATGNVIGTPEYMSPEQARGEEKVDGRSDLYSLGMVLHEMITGQTTFGRVSAMSILGRLVYESEEFKLSFPEDTLPSVKALIAELLKKNRTERPSDAGNLSDRIAAILEMVNEKTDQLEPLKLEFVAEELLDEAHLNSKNPSPETTSFFETLPPSNIPKNKVSFLLSEIIKTILSNFLEKLSVRQDIKLNDRKGRNKIGENSEVKEKKKVRNGAKRKIDLTQMEQTPGPDDFFSAEEFQDAEKFQGTLFFKNKSARYSEIEKRMASNRGKLDDEHTALIHQAKITYWLWVISVSLGFSTFLFGIIAMLLGSLPEGIATASATGIVYFIQKIFQQREDHYTKLAKDKNRHLEYGDKWLLAIQTIDSMEDNEERSKRQARLADAITDKMFKD